MNIVELDFQSRAQIEEMHSGHGASTTLCMAAEKEGSM